MYLADKQRSSDWTAKLCRLLDLDGAMVSQEGFGNPDTGGHAVAADDGAVHRLGGAENGGQAPLGIHAVDVGVVEQALCKKIELQGVKTVIITDEYAGQDGKSQSLADADPLADAVVTGGNANEVIILPKMDKVIGTLDFVDVIAGGHAGVAVTAGVEGGAGDEEVGLLLLDPVQNLLLGVRLVLGEVGVAADDGGPPC